MENLAPITKTIRLSYCDPGATDSSSDEDSHEPRKKSKRQVHEIEVEFVGKNQTPRSDPGNFQDGTGFKKPNLTTEGEEMVGVRAMSANSLPPVRKKIQGVRMRNGKFCAEIKNPFTKRGVWLGSFASEEEASRAYLAKKTQFAAIKLSAKWRTDWLASDKSAFQDSVSPVLHNDISELTSIQEGARTRISGVRRKKSCKFCAQTTCPNTKRRVCIVTSATEEESSGAYLAKDAEFEAKKLIARRRSDRVASGKSAVLRKDTSELTSCQEGARTRITGIQRRYSGKFPAEIRNPTTKGRVWIDTFASKEEACGAYLAKEGEVVDELRARQGFGRVASEKSSPPACVSSVVEIETSNEAGVAESVGENKVSGYEEAEFGFFNGVQVLDRNGFLVGEFSMLDDLSICSNEEDANP